VVDIKKTKVYDMGTGMWRHTAKGETQAGAYNAHPEIQKLGAWAWAMPYIAKEQNGVTSRIALRNNANCNKITGVIVIHDETGRAVTTIPVPWLHPKHMKIVDLAYFGQIARGFVGAAKFFVTDVEQLCDTDNDGITNQLPVMPSIVVLNYGFATELPIGSGAGPLTDKGDLTRVYEAFPIYYRAEACEGSLFGTATVRNADHGYDFPYLRDVEVWINGEDTGVMSDSTGGYQVRPVDQGPSVVTFKKSGELQGGFFDLDMDAEVECGKETKLDPELICSNPLFVTVEDRSGNAIPGATVTAEVTFEVNGEGDETYTTGGDPDGVTDNAGMAEFDVAGAGDVDLEVTAAGHDPLEFDGQPEVPHHGGESENEDCRDTLYAGVELCKYNTVVGTVWIGLLPAEGYTLELVDMSVDPPAVVDTDVTTILGVYSLEGLSAAHGTYRINLYNAGGTFISTTGDFDVDANCGDTGMISYYSGNWGGSGFE
jgi:hypothetical protein